MGGFKHAPARLSTYLRVHESRMQQFRDEGFVGADTLEITSGPGTMAIRGHIACLGRLVVAVEKYLSVSHEGTDLEVETFAYSYNVFVQGLGNVLRYDNAHPHHGHPDDHHKHTFDRPGGEATIEWVGREEWPTLGDVLDEVRNWYWAHRARLPAPDEWPDLSACRPPGMD